MSEQKPSGGGRVKVIRDARELRALAHPLRHRLMTELMACEVASVGQLAERMGEPVNSVSYHLRQLAKYDFIEPAPELARDGRDRWWRMPYAEGFDYADELWEAQSARALLTEMAGRETRRRLDGIARAFPVPGDGEGRHARDWTFRMNPGEAEEFNRDLIDLLTRWRSRTREASGSGERMTLTFYSFLFPSRFDEKVDEPVTGSDGALSGESNDAI